MSWPTGKVLDIADVISGYAFKSTWFGAGSTKIIRIGDLQNGLICDENAKRFDSSIHAISDRFKIKPGDVLMAMSGATVGKIAIAREKDSNSYLNQRVLIIRGKSEPSSDYLKYAFSGSILKKLLLSAGGAAQPNLSPKSVGNMEIPIPPLAEQKRIAEILDKADAIRLKRQQAIELADEFLRSVFLDMFGDPVVNPKGWETDKLINLCPEKMQNGAYFPKESYSDEGVEMVHMSDAFYDEVQRGKLKRVRCSNKDLKRYSLNSQDLLISRRSLTYEGAAKPSLIPLSVEPLIFESSLIRVSPDNSKILTYFLFYYLSNESVKEQHIRKYVTGATIKGISQKNLEQVEVYVPPINLQRKFLAIAETTKKSLQKYNCGRDDLGLLFDSLSQKAFSGEL